MHAICPHNKPCRVRRDIDVEFEIANAALFPGLCGRERGVFGVGHVVEGVEARATLEVGRFVFFAVDD